MHFDHVKVFVQKGIFTPCTFSEDFHVSLNALYYYKVMQRQVESYANNSKITFHIKL